MFSYRHQAVPKIKNRLYRLPKLKIHEIGGEFALIDRLTRFMRTSHEDLVAGIGDDAAVIKGLTKGKEYLLVTTDMLVEASHFRQDWSTPVQIGLKAVACNVSDIAAMGGTPTFMFVSLSLVPETEVSWIESLYHRMDEACKKYGVVIAGGDTTQGNMLTISITLLGRVSFEDLCLRGHARHGDLLCVTGPLGGSAAGLNLLMNGKELPETIKKKHLTPGCRLDVSPEIAPLAGAMIDISDGLAPEVNHICDQSGTGAEIYADKIPFFPLVKKIAKQTGKSPLDFALSGGEDFELLFSISQKNLRLLETKGIEIYIVGRVTEAEAGRSLILPDGKRTSLAGGFNHFS